MQTMTHEEMAQLSGGLETACATYTGLWAVAEAGVVLGLMTGGIGFGIAVIGMGAALYSMMEACSP